MYLLEARSMSHVPAECAARWEVWEGLQVRGLGKRRVWGGGSV